jgi:hypothetical protein
MIRRLICRWRGHRWGEPTITNSGFGTLTLRFEVCERCRERQYIPEPTKPFDLSVLMMAVEQARQQYREQWSKVIDMRPACRYGSKGCIFGITPHADCEVRS